MINLLPFQKEDAAWLKSKRQALLAHEMGVGKTPIAIEACRYLKRVLVICPSVAKYNWQSEFKKFANRDAYVAGDQLTFSSKNTVITSFNYAASYLKKYARRKWDAIIVDESHGLKEPSAGRTRAILGQNGLIHSTTHFWCLSGTPAPNHAGELWTLLYTFGVTKLSYQGFIARYCNTYIEGSGRFSRTVISGTNTKNSPELKAMIKKIAIRRMKKDVYDLPPKIFSTFYIKGESDAKLFKEHPELEIKMREELKLLSEKLDIENINPKDEKLLSTLQLLGPSVSSLRRYHGLKKVKETADLIKEELSRGLYKKIIVFGVHTIVLETLHDLLIDYGPVTVTGKVSAINRKGAVDIFQTKDECRVFIGNVKAAGVAITLTAADQVIFIEEDWVPGNNAQAVDRAHRYGQKQTVNVRHIAIKDSFDAKLTETLVRKIKEISTFIE